MQTFIELLLQLYERKIIYVNFHHACVFILDLLQSLLLD